MLRLRSGPTHRSKCGSVRHCDESKDTEQDVGHLPELRAGNRLVMKHRLGETVSIIYRIF